MAAELSLEKIWSHLIALPKLQRLDRQNGNHFQCVHLNEQFVHLVSNLFGRMGIVGLCLSLEWLDCSSIVAVHLATREMLASLAGLRLWAAR